MFPDGFKLTQVSEQNKNEVSELTSLVFVTGEPLSKGTISVEKFKKFTDVVVEGTLTNEVSWNLSFVLLDPSGKVCSFLHSEDYTTPQDYSSIFEQEDMKPVCNILELLDELYVEFKENNRILPGEYAHFFMGGTAPGYEGKGIGSNMRKIALAVAKAAGFKGWTVEASNPITRKIWSEKLGGKIEKKIGSGNEDFDKKFPHLKDTKDYYISLITGKME